jgi:hypothetical protein
MIKASLRDISLALAAAMFAAPALIDLAATEK